MERASNFIEGGGKTREKGKGDQKSPRAITCPIAYLVWRRREELPVVEKKKEELDLRLFYGGREKRFRGSWRDGSISRAQRGADLFLFVGEKKG